MMSRFAVFILTNKRASNVITYKTLRDAGYTGRIVLVVDDEDPQAEEYEQRYPGEVYVFSKQQAIEYTDSGDNFGKRNSVVYARNWSFKIAEDLGLSHFWQLDDDYTTFRYAADGKGNYVTKKGKVKSLDFILSEMIEFMDSAEIHSIALGQGGDYIGGEGSRFVKLAREGKFSRKIMNSFLFRTDRPVKFMGRINEDVNLYVTGGKKGVLFITLPMLRLEQCDTQQNSGGLTEIYLDLGTYVKSFYSVMYEPSCVFINEMGNKHRRLHHRVDWKKTTPMIVSEKVRVF